MPWLGLAVTMVLLLPAVLGQGPASSWDPEFASEIEGAVKTMQEERVAIAQANPGLVEGQAPSGDAVDIHPAAAFHVTARNLALDRVRVQLGANGTLEETMQRAEAWRMAIVAEAKELVAEVEAARVPPPGLALEGVLLRQGPAFRVVAQEYEAEMSVMDLQRHWPDTGLLVAAMARIEAQRVQWQHLEPVLPAMTLEEPYLTYQGVMSIQRNATYPAGSAYARDADLLALEAISKKNGFGAVGFSTEAQRAHSEGTSRATATVFGYPLRPLIEQEHALFAQEPQSTLSLWVQGQAEYVLASDAGGESEAEVLGQYGLLRLLRGMPALPKPAAAPQEESHEAVGLEAASTVVLLGLAAAWRRR